jgi:hypothetical protein
MLWLKMLGTVEAASSKEKFCAMIEQLDSNDPSLQT